jgi:hypothetical protein
VTAKGVAEAKAFYEAVMRVSRGASWSSGRAAAGSGSGSTS